MTNNYPVIIILMFFAAASWGQTSGWPQSEESLDRRGFYRDDVPTTRGLVWIPPSTCDGDTSGSISGGFFMLSHEVCNRQWLEFITATSSKSPHLDFDTEEGNAYHRRHSWTGRIYAPGTSGMPIVGITREEAILFCQWRTKATGLAHRLPTEEEWDFAAGHAIYPWGDGSEGIRVVSLGRSMEVGPDPYYVYTDDITPTGIRHLLGNVEEFTSSNEGPFIVLKGFGFRYPASLASLKTRKLAVRDAAGYDLGFRYVVEP